MITSPLRAVKRFLKTWYYLDITITIQCRIIQIGDELVDSSSHSSNLASRSRTQLFHLESLLCRLNIKDQPIAFQSSLITHPLCFWSLIACGLRVCFWSHVPHHVHFLIWCASRSRVLPISLELFSRQKIRSASPLKRRCDRWISCYCDEPKVRLLLASGLDLSIPIRLLVVSSPIGAKQFHLVEKSRRLKNKRTNIIVSGSALHWRRLAIEKWISRN
jgi:hypothetical protein